MSAETKVDVLAVMDEMLDCYGSVEECPDDTGFLEVARQARAAVAELIAADREYDEARAEMDLRRNDITPLLWNRWVIAFDRRAAALSRIGAGQ